MLVRISLLMVAMDPKARANAGSILLLSPFQPIMANICIPVACISLSPRKYWRIDPMMKDGTDTPMRAKNIAVLSHAVPRFTAATTPRRIPIINANMSALIPRSKDTGNASPITSDTALPSGMEIPKSPCTKLVRYIISCSGTDLSRPYFALTASSTAGGRAFPDMNGSPGRSCIRRNVTTTRTRMVIREITTRFSIYLI